jgi:hypothetical protein
MILEKFVDPPLVRLWSTTTLTADVNIGTSAKDCVYHFAEKR